MYYINSYGDTSEIPDDNWRSLCKKINQWVGASGVFFKDVHYFRNKLNRVPETLDEMVAINSNPLLAYDKKWILLKLDTSAYHMYETDFSDNGLRNLKFVSYDGIYEAVYNHNGELCTDITDATNMGTYNYASHITNFLGHARLDVYPYADYLPVIGVPGNGWGNIPNDVLPGSYIENFNRFKANDIEGQFARIYRDVFKINWLGKFEDLNEQY